jgi:hypothetical protein
MLLVLLFAMSKSFMADEEVTYSTHELLKYRSNGADRAYLRVNE